MKSWLAPLLAASAVTAAKYDQYILAPSSRTIYPVSVWQNKVNGTVDNPASIAGEGPGSTTFRDVSAVTYDFGKNIAGVVSLKIGQTDPNQFIGLTYSESSEWISGEGSDATQDAGIDEIIGFFPNASGVYTVDRDHERGGFRYLSLIHNTTGNIEVQQISVAFTAVPTTADDQLQNYTGYFNCDDELVNRVWYAGAYTNQMCTIDPHHGNSLTHLGQVSSKTPGDSVPPWNWYFNYTLFNGTSAISDGAKRDRLVWPGDIFISGPSIFVSTNDMDTIKQSIYSLFALQNATGQLPYAGSLRFATTYSPTYHQYNLLDLYDYYRFTLDTATLQDLWDQWKKGLSFTLGFIDSSGLFNATTSADWLRFGMGGHNIEANAITHYTLGAAIELATALNDTANVTYWQNTRDTLKTQVNAKLWDPSVGLYRDNETTTLNPQDGNAWAVISNITNDAAQSAQISTALHARWGPYGAPAPEAGSTVSPFIGGFEVQTHALAGNVSAALDLVRLQWGFMLNDPRMTNSTFIEGYAFNGDLHYAPYSNDPRVSHAHGWATGPTSFLSFYVAGLQIVTAGGQTWKLAPRLGDLKRVDAGFMTPLGMFAANTTVSDDGGLSLNFTTPTGTSGMVSLAKPSCGGTLKMTESSGAQQPITVDVTSASTGDVEVPDVKGGQWQATFTCVARQTTNGAAGSAPSSITAMAVFAFAASIVVTM